MIFRKIKSQISNWKPRFTFARIDNYNGSPEPGFNKIEFPIIIQDGHDLMLVLNLEEFYTDPDLYFHEFDNTMKLIDSTGKQFSWGYNQIKSSNFPDKFEKELTLKEVQQIFDDYFLNCKKKPEFHEVNNINELIEKVKDNF